MHIFLGITFLTVIVAPNCAPPLKQQEMKALAELATRHHMPMPPKSARLALVHTGYKHQLKIPTEGGDPGIYAPGFLLEEKPDGTVVVLRGMERITLSVPYEKPFWRPFTLRYVEGTFRGYETRFTDLSTFICAIQVAARGDYDTASTLASAYRERVPDRLKNPQLLLARCFRGYLRDQLLEGAEKWREIHTRLVELFREFPELKTEEPDPILVQDEWPELFNALTATLNAKPPAPGSVESLVLAFANRPSRGYDFEIFSDPTSGDRKKPLREIALRGFGAIPDLIALLGDRRITAHESGGINHVCPRIIRVGSLSSMLLYRLVGGGDVDPPDEPDPQAWRAWWEKNRGQDERRYYVAGVFYRNEKQIASVNNTVANIIAQKWPTDLPDLCVQFTTHAGPDADPFGLASALAEARLPKAERVATLAAFARRGTFEHRMSVLRALAKLDAEKAAEVAIPLLDTIPNDTFSGYIRRKFVPFRSVVIIANNDALWRKYVRIVKQSEVRLRMEALNGMSLRNDEARQQRLAFLSVFLADETVRDLSSKPVTDIFAAYNFPRLAVRDFVAMEIASLLKLDDLPDTRWTAEDWSRLREKVRTKLAAERLPDLGQ
ncbi:hypothetical protein [Fimbriiglobus ruber]|nr:hypothetical protein [Fimbriiglobus ruber]